MKRTNVLVVGAGSIGERHTRCFLRTQKCDVSVCEVDAAKREKLAKTYGIKQTFVEFDKVTLSDFDAVVVATPSPLHMPQAIAAARAGCHILCEKPLSNTCDRIQELIDTLKAKNRVGATGFMMRSANALRRVKELIDQGVIGTPRLAMANITQYLPHTRPEYQQVYFAKKAMGGGCLFDMCPHSVNLIEWFLGPEAQASCMLDRLALEGIETDDTTLISFRHRHGALSQISVTMISQNYCYDLSVHGTSGSVVYDYVKGEVAVHMKPEPANKPMIEKFPIERDDLYVAQAENFLAAVHGERPVACSIEEGWQTLRAVFAAQRAARTGAYQTVE